MNATSNTMDELGPDYLDQVAEPPKTLLASPAFRIWFTLLLVIFGLGTLGGFTQLVVAIDTLERSRLVPLFSAIGLITAVLAFTIGQAFGSPVVGSSYVGRREDYSPAPRRPRPEELKPGADAEPLTADAGSVAQPSDDEDDFTQYFDRAEPRTYDSLEGAHIVVQEPGDTRGTDRVAPLPKAAASATQSGIASTPPPLPVALGPRWLLAFDNFITRPVSRRTIVITVLATSSISGFATWHWVGSIGQTVTALIGVALLSALFSRVTQVAAQSRQVVDDLRVTNDHLVQEIVNRRIRDNAVDYDSTQNWAASVEFDNAPLHDLEALRTKFLNEVSHELRGPITAINLAARIIMKHHVYDHDVVERFGSTIVSEGDRLAHIVNEFLELAKIESGCLRWSDDRCEPIDIITSAIFASESSATERNIKLEAQTEEDLPPIVADRDRIVQALTILITNALRNAPGNGTISVQAHRGNAETLFAVEDQGAGKHEEKRFNIFGSQTSSAPVESDKPTTDTGGHGLGLCIASEIANHYGGEMWAEGRVGKASAYLLSIPDEPPLPNPVVGNGNDCDPSQGAARRSTVETSQNGNDALPAELSAQPVDTLAATAPILEPASTLPTVFPPATAVAADDVADTEADLDTDSDTELELETGEDRYREEDDDTVVETAANAQSDDLVDDDTPRDALAFLSEPAENDTLGDDDDREESLHVEPLTDAYSTAEPVPWEAEFEQHCISEQMSIRELDDVLYGRAASPVADRFYGADDDESSDDEVEQTADDDSSGEAGQQRSLGSSEPDNDEQRADTPQLTEVKRGFGFSLFRNGDNTDSGAESASADGDDAPVDAFAAWVAREHANAKSTAEEAAGDSSDAGADSGTDDDGGNAGQEPQTRDAGGPPADKAPLQVHAASSHAPNTELRKSHGEWQPASQVADSYIRRPPNRD